MPFVFGSGKNRMQEQKTEILTQSTSEIAAARLTPKFVYWVAALASAPIFGIVTAFGFAPTLSTVAVPLKTVVETLEVPALAESAPAETPQRYWREERVQRSDTVAELMNRLGVDDRAAVEFLRTSPRARSFHQLRPGRIVSAIVDDNGALQSLRYAWDNNNLFAVERRGDAFEITESAISPQTRVQMKSAEIRSSLFAATDAADVPDNVATQLADIFGGDIDFHRDLRRGDHFTVIYEVLENNGEFLRSGRVLAAEFANQNKTYRAVYFEDAAHHGGYYGADGKTLRKAFLRSPLEFSRISSGFTSSRFHPILQQWRAHRGVDYAAPIGTRVRATGDGVVEFAGIQHGYGKVVVLRHQGKYSTWYGHLSGFANGVRTGTHVSQGNVIAYVGQTGLATGPHLHYEFRVANVQANPLSVVLPTAPPLNGAMLGQFHDVAAPMLSRLDLLRNTNLALID
jgi:murein DD-endopeptidase MepM/ murein hydrolase activator NlpD